MQITLKKKDNCINRDKIVKLSCYFAKIYDREFNKKHIGVNLFYCIFVYMNNVENFV